MTKGKRLLTNTLDADGGVHLPLDLRGHDSEHVVGAARVIEGTPVSVPRGIERRPAPRDARDAYGGLGGYSRCLNQLMDTPHFAYQDGHRIA
ncbi:MAG: hypothetical protein AABX53_04180 [Nanoarchaeota archaeon]